MWADRPTSGDAQRVVAYLVDQWAQQFLSTSMPLAMANLDMAPDDVLRLEITTKTVSERRGCGLIMRLHHRRAHERDSRAAESAALMKP